MNVNFSFSTQILSGLTHDGTYLTGFNSSGTGEVNGPIVEAPEPASMLLFGLGLLSTGLVARRRRQ